MKQIGAITFITCFLLMTFNKAVTLINFYYNQDVLTAKYCVNKKRPKMNCNGKCFLAKQINEQEKREAANAVIELSKIEVVSATSYYDLQVHQLRCNIKLRYPNLFEPICKSAPTRLLRPPGVV